MALTPMTVERFGGLNVAVDPFEVGPEAATDLVNVDFDKLGRVHTRAGFTRVKALTLTMDTGDGEGLAFYDSISAKQIIVGYSQGGTLTIAAYATTGGAAIASVTPTGSAYVAAARGTTGSTEYLYLANGNNSDTIRRWSGSAFSSPGGMPKASCLAAVPVSGRLAAGATGTTKLSRVEFSNPYAAETWTASDFVDLAPGDGFITALVSWQDMLFAFKPNRFFVFYGESVDADGGAIFNYRGVDRYGGYGAVAGNEGVYFWDTQKLWLTTGGAPQRVSELVEPILRGEVSVNGETVNPALTIQHRLSYAGGRLYIAMIISGGGRRTLVFDPKTNQWTYYSLDVNFAGDLPASLTGPPSPYYLSSAGIEHLDGATTDNGSAVTWSYKSGRYPLSENREVAITRESSLVGSGTVALRLDTDLYSNQNGSATLGTAPATAEGWPSNVDQEGTWLQHTLSGTGAATVHRLTHFVSSIKPAGVR